MYNNISAELIFIVYNKIAQLEQNHGGEKVILLLAEQLQNDQKP